MKFYIGEEVVLIRGDHEFQYGKIIDSSDMYGVGVYTVDLLDGTCQNKVIEYDIISVDKTKNIKEPAEALNIDISKYLTRDQMEGITRDMFKLKISRRIDDALEARKGQGSMTDLMIREITTDYAKRLGDKFETELVQRIKEVVYLKEVSSAEDYDDTFLGSIKNVLWSITNDWVGEHKDEVIEWIRPGLKTYAEKLMSDIVANRITNKLSSIISKALQEVLQDIYNNGISNK